MFTYSFFIFFKRPHLFKITFSCFNLFPESDSCSPLVAICMLPFSKSSCFTFRSSFSESGSCWSVNWTPLVVAFGVCSLLARYSAFSASSTSAVRRRSRKEYLWSSSSSRGSSTSKTFCFRLLLLTERVLVLFCAEIWLYSCTARSL